jgi:hypothetical protein
VFPYTKGFYVIAELVGTMNPEDLDAMDESVPFTKFTLDNFLGVQGTDADFRRYFDGFKLAQSVRQVVSKLDRIKQSFNWEPAYGDLLRERSRDRIALVQQFKQQLAAALDK